MAEVDRITTGIYGLDALIDGGVPRGFSVLVTGYAGTGKTVMALQMLTHMSLNNEKCMYLTFENTDETMIRQAQEFKWDVDKALESGNLEIHSLTKYEQDITSIVDMVKKQVGDGVTVVAFDSLTMLSSLGHLYRSKFSSEMAKASQEQGFIPSGDEVRREHISYIIREVESLGVTSIWVAEAHPSKENASTITTDGVSEYQCDGVIYLEKHLDGGRTLSIEKMRCTKTEDKPYSLHFIDEGIGVNPARVRGK